MELDKQCGLILCAVFTICNLSVAVYGDTFIWGTEGNGFLISDFSNMPIEKKEIMNQVNQTLGVKYVKVRVSLPIGGEPTPSVCSWHQAFYTGDDPLCDKPDAFHYNLDQTAELFEKNGWSMFPMFSHAGGPGCDIPIDSTHIERFVDFVDWFVGRYGEKADIQYIELVNAPYHVWDGTEKQLLELNNKTYERIKTKYPDVKVGTPGFEYYRDTATKLHGQDQHRFRNYFLNNDAKFDFWAFHGYPILGDAGRTDIYPPTKTASHDSLAGIKGIIELRKRMNERGWQDRDIIDTEHTGLFIQGRRFSEDEDRANAAFMVQELVLKRSLELEGKKVLAGIISLKMLPHCERSREDRKKSGGTQMQRPDRKNPGPPQGLPPRAPHGLRPEIQGIQRPVGTFGSRPGAGGRGGMTESSSEKSIFDAECTWGSLNPDGSPSETVQAVGLLISKLKGLDHAGHISGNFDDASTVWIEKFSAPGRDLYICFKPFAYRSGKAPAIETATLPGTIKLTGNPDKIEITDIFGTEIKPGSGQTISIQVGNAPQFIDVIPEFCTGIVKN